MRISIVTAAALIASPGVVCSESTSAQTGEICYTTKGTTHVDFVPTSTISITTDITRTLTKTYTPFVHAAANSASDEAGVTTRFVTVTTTITSTFPPTTITPYPSFTPIKKSKYISKPHPLPKGVDRRRDVPTKQQRRRRSHARFAHAVTCEEHVENISYTTLTETASPLMNGQTAPSKPNQNELVTSFKPSSTTKVTVTSTATYYYRPATHYPACQKDNFIDKNNGTYIFNARYDQMVVIDDEQTNASPYGCCVACMRLLATFTCGGFAWDPNSIGISGNPSDKCQLLSGGQVYSGSAVTWGFETAEPSEESLLSDGVTVGNGDCGQGVWHGSSSISGDD